jgi:hypothetical protein
MLWSFINLAKSFYEVHTRPTDGILYLRAVADPAGFKSLDMLISLASMYIWSNHHLVLMGTNLEESGQRARVARPWARHCFRVK